MRKGQLSRKVFALLLTLAMVMTYMPAMALTAFATEEDYVAKIGDKGYGSLYEAFNDAKDGDTVIISSHYRGENDLDAIGKLNGKEVTVQGGGMNTTSLKVIYSKQDQHITNCSTITFKNLDITFKHATGMPYTETLSANYDTVKINGLLSVYAGKSVLKNCVFTGPQDKDKDVYLFWQYTGEAELDNCTFEKPATKGAVKIYAESGYHADMTVKNCTFSSLSGTTYGCGIYASNKNNIDKPIYNLYVSNNTVPDGFKEYKPSGNGITAVNPTFEDGKYKSATFITANTEESTVKKAIEDAAVEGFVAKKDEHGNYIIEPTTPTPADQDAAILKENGIEIYYPVPEAGGFYASGTTYGATTDFYITRKTGLEYVAKLTNQEITTMFGMNFDYSSRAFNGKKVHLLVDVDLTGGNWNPIGYNVQSVSNGGYYGSFNGHNKTIKGLNISNTSMTGKYYRAGLFGYVTGGGTFENVTLENVNINTTANYAGSLIGYSANNGTKIKNITVKGQLNITGPNTVGGVIGYCMGSVSDCSVQASTGSSLSATWNCGGITGQAMETSTYTNNAVSDITVTASSGAAGGIVGGYHDEITLTGCSLNDVIISSVDGKCGTALGNSNGGDNKDLIKILNFTTTGEISKLPFVGNSNAEGPIAVGSEVTLDDNNKVYAGTYEWIGNAAIASGYEKVTTQDGKWKVQEKQVAQIGEEKYKTLAAALKAANSGDTIVVLDGTWGADAIGTLTTAEAGQVRYKTLTIQPAEGANVKFTSDVSLGYDDSSTANAKMTVKGFSFENASLSLSNYVQATVENCNFIGSGDAAGSLVVKDSCCRNHKTTESYLDSFITIKNCHIDGTDSGKPGIRLRNSGNVSLTDNTVINAKHNGILFESNASNDNTNAKSITVIGNKITDWNAENIAEGGRAIRLAGGGLDEGSTIAINGNYFSKTELNLDEPDFVKIDGANNATVNLDGNAWNYQQLEDVNGKAKIYTVNGGTPTINSVIAYVAKIDDEKYTSLAAAVAAAKAGDTVKLLCDVKNGDGVDFESGKNITVDFGGHTYTFQGRTVGSTGTVTNGFRVLKGANITFKNGTLNNGNNVSESSVPAKVMLNNYGTTKLENFSIDATSTATATSGNPYGSAVLYVANGSMTVTGTGKYVADPDGENVIYMSNVTGYSDGATLTFDANYTGSVTGEVITGQNQTANINIQNGCFDFNEITFGSTKPISFKLSGGVFTNGTRDLLNETKYLESSYTFVSNTDTLTNNTYPNRVSKTITIEATSGIKDSSGTISTSPTIANVIIQNDVDADFNGPYNSGSDIKAKYTMTETYEEAYDFEGWYTKANDEYKKVSTSKEYVFTAKTDLDLVAVFTLASTDEGTLQISTANGKVTAGSTQITDNGTLTYRAGDKVQLVAEPAEGYLFQYWTENGAVISRNENYTFKFAASRKICAVFATPTDNSAVVVFKTTTGDSPSMKDQTLSAELVKAKDTIAQPVVPSYQGYVFDGWTIQYKDGSSKTIKVDPEKRTIADATLQEAISLSNKEIVSMVANYEAPTETYKIKITYENASRDKLADDVMLAGEYKIGEAVNVTAQSTVGDKTFMYWKYNDIVLTNDNKCTVRPNSPGEDGYVTVTAVYGDEAIQATPKIVLSEHYSEIENAKKKIAVTASYNVPNVDSKTVAEVWMHVSCGDKKKDVYASSIGTKNGTMTVHFAVGDLEGQPFTFKAFMKLSNGDIVESQEGTYTWGQ